MDYFLERIYNINCLIEGLLFDMLSCTTIDLDCKQQNLDITEEFLEVNRSENEIS